MVDRVKSRIGSALEEAPPQWLLYFPDRWDTKNSAPEIVRSIQAHYREAAKIQTADGQALLLQRK
jgi:hypothetical protein